MMQESEHPRSQASQANSIRGLGKSLVNQEYQLRGTQKGSIKNNSSTRNKGFQQSALSGSEITKFSDDVDWNSSSDQSQQLLKIVLFTIVCSSKLKYQPDVWSDFKEAIIFNIQFVAKNFTDVVMGLNIQNNDRRVKDS